MVMFLYWMLHIWILILGLEIGCAAGVIALPLLSAFWLVEPQSSSRARRCGQREEISNMYGVRTG